MIPLHVISEADNGSVPQLPTEESSCKGVSSPDLTPAEEAAREHFQTRSPGGQLACGTGGDIYRQTDVSEASCSEAPSRTRRVTPWQSGAMVLRWATLLTTERQFRRASDYQPGWMLQAFLDEPGPAGVVNPKDGADC